VERDDGIHLPGVSPRPRQAESGRITLSPWRRSSIMTSLEPSNAIAAHWHRNPNISKWISP
jgi:hypothetical protein